MKKVFLLFAFAVCFFTASTGYSETKNPIKNQTDVFVGASELP